MSRNTGGIVRDERKDPFARVSIELIKRFGPLIGINGLAVYTILAAHVNKFTHRTFVSPETIAVELGNKKLRRTVERAISLLIQHGLVYRESGKLKGLKSEYILRDLPRVKISGSTPLFEDQEDEGGASLVSHPPMDQESPLLDSTTYKSESGGCDTGVVPGCDMGDVPGATNGGGGVRQTVIPNKEEPDRSNQIETPSSSLQRTNRDDDGENKLPGSVRDQYIGKVLDAYREMPGTAKTYASDARLAGDLYDRKVPLQAVINGITLGIARRLFRDGGPPPGDVRSLAYFRAVIDEVQATEVSDDYYRHIRSSLEKWTRKNETARLRTALTTGD